MVVSRKTVVTLLGAVLAVIFVSGVYTVNWLIDMQRTEYRDREARLTVVEREIGLAKANIKVMETQKEHMQTAVGIEDAAREKLGMVRPGEVAYVVSGAPEEKKPSVKANPVVSEPVTERSPGVLLRVFGPFLF